jgi:hypothetical protein
MNCTNMTSGYATLPIEVDIYADRGKSDDQITIRSEVEGSTLRIVVHNGIHKRGDTKPDEYVTYHVDFPNDSDHYGGGLRYDEAVTKMSEAIFANAAGRAMRVHERHLDPAYIGIVKNGIVIAERTMQEQPSGVSVHVATRFIYNRHRDQWRDDTTVNLVEGGRT